MTSADSRARRRAIAAHLNQIPTSCPADVYEWAETGHQVIEDEYGDLTSSPDPDVASGVHCAFAAAVHKHGCCWCGKFRTGLELAETVELPVHELALAAEPSRWLDAIEPTSLLDTVAEAMDLGGDDRA